MSLPYLRDYTHVDHIPYLDTPPTYEDFFRFYLYPNIPVLIGPALTENWRARQEWTGIIENRQERCKDRDKNKDNIDDNNHDTNRNENVHRIRRESQNVVPNFAYLRQRFGDAQVSVANCSQRYFTDQPRVHMKFCEFIDIWKKTSLQRQGISQETIAIVNADGDRANDDELLYLKDWHFVKAFPEYSAYDTPEIFQGVSDSPI
ncbi:4032_t:CDS:1 [Paraglomus occultum]|uniref:4032_t:CDS:1 n=1 Tax=Paraglomus occultum TaxID=144539 RepID=A0A9N8ZV03_9GLOM|nr:4032_t:CDS:1 [Paraglomus occultum]